MRRRRRAVAGSGLGADAGVRRPAAAGRAGRDRVRRARAGRGAAARARAARCTGLRDGDARALLGSAVRFMLDERVRDRIIAETRGNPLALLELPRGLTATQLAGGFGLLAAQALSGTDRGELRPPARDAPRGRAASAAASPRPSPSAIRCCCWRACRAPRHRAPPRSTRQADGLLAIGERVTFRHPLVRSAVYRSAAAQERRAVHLALAEATDRRRRSRTAVRGIWRRPRRGPTRRSPWSSSARPAGRRRAAGSPRRRRSCSAPSR